MSFVPPELAHAEQIEAQRDLNRMRARTRIQMPLIDFASNFMGYIVFDSGAPLQLFNAAAHYRGALGREFGMGSGDIRGTDIKAEDGNRQFWLLPSRKRSSIRPLIAGAAGFYFDDQSKGVAPARCLEWVYLHPYERQDRLFSLCRLAFERAYGDFVCVGPFTTGGHAACQSIVNHSTERIFGHIV